MILIVDIYGKSLASLSREPRLRSWDCIMSSKVLKEGEKKHKHECVCVIVFPVLNINNPHVCKFCFEIYFILKGRSGHPSVGWGHENGFQPLLF